MSVCAIAMPTRRLALEMEPYLVTGSATGTRMLVRHICLAGSITLKFERRNNEPHCEQQLLHCHSFRCRVSA